MFFSLGQQAKTSCRVKNQWNAHSTSLYMKYELCPRTISNTQNIEFTGKGFGGLPAQDPIISSTFNKCLWKNQKEKNSNILVRHTSKSILKAFYEVSFPIQTAPSPTQLCILAHTCSPSTEKLKQEDCCEFQTCLHYNVRLYLKQNKRWKTEIPRWTCLPQELASYSGVLGWEEKVFPSKDLMLFINISSCNVEFQSCWKESHLLFICLLLF